MTLSLSLLSSDYHCFHKGCLSGWVSQRKHTCPVCREAFKKAAIPTPPNIMLLLRLQDMSTRARLLQVVRAALLPLPVDEI